ncbi:MAG: 30S ribosomal protein S8e [Candidatus Nanohaloarchaea archaeon]
MAVWHDRSQTKKTGGRTRSYRKSRKYDQGDEFSAPELGGDKVIVNRVRGDNRKQVVKKAEKVNLSVNGEVKRVEIEAVKDNSANPNFVRRSLLTKGAKIETPEGTARITSRPGQDGVVNAVLEEE